MLLIQILGGCAAAALLYALYTLCSNIYNGVGGWFAARRKKNEDWNEMVADLDAKVCSECPSLRNSRVLHTKSRHKD